MFTPRGVGETLPYLCFGSTADSAEFFRTAPTTSNSSDAALGLVWAYNDLLAETCYNKLADIGDLVGTAFAARDLIQVVDALGGDRKLRYWGEL